MLEKHIAGDHREEPLRETLHLVSDGGRGSEEAAAVALQWKHRGLLLRKCPQTPTGHYTCGAVRDRAGRGSRDKQASLLKGRWLC